MIFHTDQGSEYTAELFAKACRNLGVTQSMGRVGSALDNAAAESFFSTLEHELLSRRHFTTKEQARREIAVWIDRYNRVRRHSTIGMRSPVDYELAALGTATELKQVFAERPIVETPKGARLCRPAETVGELLEP